MKTEYRVGNLVMTRKEYRRNNVGIFLAALFFDVTLFLFWYFFCG